MEVKRKGLPDSPPAALNEAIISTWRRLGAAAVGERELLAIQQTLDEEISPARIASELAAAGAELRHPEVIQCDARWRERQIAERLKPLARLTLLQKRAYLRLTDAEAAIAKFEALRVRLSAEEDEAALDEIKELAIDARQNALNRANDASLSSLLQDEQAEIAEWFRVWLETPQLFAQWVELRKASAVFASKFGAG